MQKWTAPTLSFGWANPERNVSADTIKLVIPADFFVPRVTYFFGKNLDGTFTVSVLVRNTYRRPARVNMRGYDLQTVINLVSTKLREAREACEIIL